MLVLLRKPGQKVHLTGGITVTVLEFRNGGVRLGFTAPETVRIVRDNAKLRTPERSRVPMDNSPGNPTPVSPAARIEGRIDP